MVFPCAVDLEVYGLGLGLATNDPVYITVS